MTNTKSNQAVLFLEYAEAVHRLHAIGSQTESVEAEQLRDEMDRMWRDLHSDVKKLALFDFVDSSYPADRVRFADLREANRRRLPQFKDAHGRSAHTEPDGSDWSDAEWLQAVVGELGEYANVRKKLLRGDYTREQALPMMRDELADVVCYLDILASRLGIDLGEAVRDKFNRVSERVGSDVKL